jgi:hypothetical protein
VNDPTSSATLIRFVPPPGERVNAPRAGYVVGLLDVAGYDVRGVMPEDSIDFRKAVRILGITKRDRLILREGPEIPAHANEVYVRVGSDADRPAESVLKAPGSGTKDDPIRDDGDPIATGRAILSVVSIGDAPPRQQR